jgi:hypothetical protein
VRLFDFRYVGSVDKKFHLTKPPHGSQSALVVIQVMVPAFGAAKIEIAAPDGVLNAVSAGKIDLTGRAFGHDIVDLARSRLRTGVPARQALADP